MLAGKFGRSTMALLAVMGLLSSGCVVVGGNWSCSSPRVWAEASETLEIDLSGDSSLFAKTHNGGITYEGSSATAGSARVVVTKKGGGRTLEDAENALAAIDVWVDDSSAEGKKLGWRWKESKRRNWGCSVSFDIAGPSEIGFEARTHNGAIRVVEVAGSVKATTHNGSIRVDSEGGPLSARTHNGSIRAQYEGSKLSLVTHNGPITVDLAQTVSIAGNIKTHNGGVKIAVGDETSAVLKCRTHNGRMKSDVPLADAERTKRTLSGSIGQGGDTLGIRTHNGSVRIKKNTG